jgi:hypothetical protein
MTMIISNQKATKIINKKKLPFKAAFESYENLKFHEISMVLAGFCLASSFLGRYTFKIPSL